MHILKQKRFDRKTLRTYTSIGPAYLRWGKALISFFNPAESHRVLCGAFTNGADGVKYLKTYKHLLMWAWLALVLGCTENPFFAKDEKVQLNLQIKGNVTFLDEEDHSDIFVWIEGLEVNTRTAENGDFTLTLDNPTSLPGGAQAWNGPYKIYYYVANYKFETSEVLIKNGEFVFDKNDLTKGGKLREDIVLEPLVKITGKILPDIPIYETVYPQQKLWITITLSPVSSSPLVFFTSYLGEGGEVSSFFLKREDGPLLESFVLFDGYPEYESGVHMGQTIVSKISLPVRLLKAGTYTVLPYVLIKQNGLPAELINNISEFANTFTLEFLKVPIKYESTKLVILKR